MWIARDKDGWLTIFEKEPVKDEECGCWTPVEGSKYENLCDVDFPQVKWEDEEATELKLNKNERSTKRRIEEEADSYAGIVKPAFINDTFDKYSIAQAFEDGAEFVLSHQWISVEEALPEYDEAVIVTTGHPDYFFCHRSDNPVVETDEDGWCNYTKEKIIAWMPIPELKAQRRR